MRLIPEPQSESNVELLGVITSAWLAPSIVLAGNAFAQSLFPDTPNCQPPMLTDDAPVLKISTHSRFALPFCGSYMISLRMTSARNANDVMLISNESTA